MDKEILFLDRDILYEELWCNSMLALSEKYQIDYNQFRKIIKELNIPYPKSGYWTKIKFNKTVSKPNLPVIDNDILKKLNNYNEMLNHDTSKPRLAKDIQERIDTKTGDSWVIMTKELAVIKNKIDKWLPKYHTIDFSKMNYRVYKEFLASNHHDFDFSHDVSPDNFIRSIGLIDKIVIVLKEHKCEISSVLSMTLDGEQISFSIHENHKRFDHAVTNDELVLISDFEKKKLASSYNLKPNIPRYDEYFGNRLSISINGQKHFNDTKYRLLENRIGEIAVEFIKQSESIQAKRLKAEKIEKVRQERTRKFSRFQAIYKNEILKIEELENIVADFELSQKLRELIKRVENNSGMDINKNWIHWAKEKADWYDPTLQKRDLILGNRKYENSKDKKIQRDFDVFNIYESSRNNGNSWNSDE